MKKTFKTRRERGGQQRLNQFSLGAPDVDMLVTRHRSYQRTRLNNKVAKEEDTPNMSSSTGGEVSEHVGSDEGKMYERKIEAARSMTGSDKVAPLPSDQVTPEEMEQRPGASWFDGTVARPAGIFSARTIRDEISEGKFPPLVNTEFVTGTGTPDKPACIDFWLPGPERERVSTGKAWRVNRRSLRGNYLITVESRYLEEKHGRGYYGLDEITGDMYCIGDEALKLVDGDKAIPVRNLDPELPTFSWEDSTQEELHGEAVMEVATPDVTITSPPVAESTRKQAPSTNDYEQVDDSFVYVNTDEQRDEPDGGSGAKSSEGAPSKVVVTTTALGAGIVQRVVDVAATLDKEEMQEKDKKFLDRQVEKMRERSKMEEQLKQRRIDEYENQLSLVKSKLELIRQGRKEMERRLIHGHCKELSANPQITSRDWMLKRDAMAQTYATYLNGYAMHLPKYYRYRVKLNKEFDLPESDPEYDYSEDAVDWDEEKYMRLRFKMERTKKQMSYIGTYWEEKLSVYPELRALGDSNISMVKDQITEILRYANEWTVQASHEIAQKWVRDQKKVGTTLPMTVTRTPGAHTAVTTTHMEPKLATREESVKKGLPVPGILEESESRKEEENRRGVPLNVDSSGEEADKYFTPMTSPLIEKKEKKTVTFEKEHEETGESTRSLIEEMKQALGEEHQRTENPPAICRVCKGTSHRGEPCLCLLCNTRHNPKSLCPCGYCGSREHTPRECTSSAAETSRYFADKTLKELQLNKFPCRVCKVIRLPHREGCPYYEEPPEKKIPVEKMVPNDSASSQYNCSACGGNHVMEECLIRNAILKQGFCDICEADPGRHYEDCPLIELYDDQGVCFYCTRRDHPYSGCPFLVKREVVDEEKPEVEHVEGPPRKRGNSDTAQGERETKRQLHNYKKDDDAVSRNCKPKGMPKMGDSNPRNEKISGQEYLEGKTSGKYCSTHRMKRGLLPRVGCYEPGGHLAPILGQHYDNEEVRLARTLQQHYDQLKEEKEAAERALKAHLAAAQNESSCDRCGRTGHMSNECPALVRPRLNCQLCGEGGHDALGCPHNVVTRKGEPCRNCGQTAHQTNSCPQVAGREYIPPTLGMRQEKFLDRPPALPVVMAEGRFENARRQEGQNPQDTKEQTYPARKHGGREHNQGVPQSDRPRNEQQPPPPQKGQKHKRDEKGTHPGDGAPGGDGGDDDGDGSDGDPDDSDEETDDTDGARTRRRRGKRRRIINKIVVDTTGFEKALTTLTDGLQTMINKQDTINKGLLDYTSQHNTTMSEQKSALDNLVEDVGQRDYKRMFDVITPYDGEDPRECEVWLEALESACEISGKDCRKMAYALSRGPVTSTIRSCHKGLSWDLLRSEIRRCYSYIKTKMHAAAAYNNFPPQTKEEGLRWYVWRYLRMHHMATKKAPEEDVEPRTLHHFLSRIYNKSIMGKVTMNSEFRKHEAGLYSLKMCTEKAMEIENQFMTTDIMGQPHDAHVLNVPYAMHEATICPVQPGPASPPAAKAGGGPPAARRYPNLNPCYRCGQPGHFAKNCPGAVVLDEPPGQIKHQLEYTTPIHPDMAGEFIKKMIETDLGKRVALIKQRKAQFKKAPVAPKQGGPPNAPPQGGPNKAYGEHNVPPHMNPRVVLPRVRAHHKPPPGLQPGLVCDDAKSDAPGGKDGLNDDIAALIDFEDHNEAMPEELAPYATALSNVAHELAEHEEETDPHSKVTG